MTIAIAVKKIRQRFLVPPWSAIAPRIGERSAMTMLPMELARPNRNVVSVASAPSLQYCFRKRGKKADITVMANAELAQSYSAQERTFRRSSISRSGVLVNRCDGVEKEATMGRPF